MPACGVAAGLSSPLVPIVVVFQLLWSAVGVKLWSRHQALLRRQWHTTVSTSTPPWPNQPGWPGSPPQQVQADANAGSAGRAPSMPVDHFGGGVPQWAVRAPNTTGVRWQFAGRQAFIVLIERGKRKGCRLCSVCLHCSGQPLPQVTALHHLAAAPLSDYTV